MTIRPKIFEVQPQAFPITKPIFESDDALIFGFNGYDNDIIKIDVIFDSGRWQEPAQQIASACSALIKSGTASLSSFELSEKIDFYGADIRATSGFNTFTFSASCLHKFLEPTLELLHTLMYEIIFPQKEIDIYVENTVSKLKVSEEKTDWQADRLFRATLFGTQHPYGYSLSKDALMAITQSQIQSFYNSLHQLKPTIIISGKYNEAQVNLIKHHVLNTNKKIEPAIVQHTLLMADTKVVKFSLPKSVQATISMGKRTIARTHEDFPAFVLLNTIFGGYFGSRLMSNIREEKGLTYGIHSAWQSFKHDSIFVIQTDTDKKNVEQCLHEIKFEMARLQNELIPAEEIQLAKNYLMGKLLHRIDGPFNQANTFKDYYVESTPMDKFLAIAEGIKAANDVTLRDLAVKYLDIEHFYTIIAG
jgi:zinc protease